jgi:hypothetical protein
MSAPRSSAKNDLVLQTFRNVAPHDTLGEPLDDGSLPDPRLTDEDWVVLRLPRENADDPADLLVPPDHRIHFSAAHRLNQVDTVFLERLKGGLRILRSHPLVPADPLHRLEDPIPGDSSKLSKRTFLMLCVLIRLNGADEEVLDRDVFVFQGLGRLFRSGQDIV